MSLFAALALTLVPSQDGIQGPPPAVPTDSASSSTRSEGWSTFWWNDYDGDGAVDALLLAPGGRAQLLHNRGGGAFEDVSEAAGVGRTSGVHMALWRDYDGDGRSDLFLASYRGSSRLLRQARPGVFLDMTEQVGLAPALDPIDAEWIDYDGDGRVDLRLTTFEHDWIYRQQAAGLFVRIQIDAAQRGPEPVSAKELPATVDEARRLRGLGRSIAEELLVEEAEHETSGRGEGFDSHDDNGATAGACAPGVEDQAVPGQCIPAATVPTLGSLYPLSNNFFIQASNGRVGIGTTTPAVRLHVAGGSIQTDGRLISTTTGQPPLVVSSNQRVANLNADLLDGLDSTAFSQLGSSIETAEIANNAVTSAKIADATVTSADLASNAVTNPKLANNAVTTAKIANGTILDADISTTAAIAGTKVLPDFGSQSIATAGNLSIGGPPLPGAQVSARGPIRVQTDQDVFRVLEIITNGFGHGAYIDVLDGVGLSAVTYQPDAFGVGGNNNSISGAQSYGVQAVTYSSQAPAIYALNSRPSPGSISAGGVLGQSRNPNGYGVWGWASNGAGFHVGTGGESSTPSGYGVYSSGNFAATGSKSFIQPHPTDASKEVRFACLEGNESGTYFRGSAQLVGGLATIAVPEEFRLVSEGEGLTVQVTAGGPTPYIYVESKDLSRIVVRGGADIPFDYLVQGLRRGYADFQTIGENQAYRPRYRGVPYGMQYPQAIRQMLIDNGTLLPDGTPNEATAAALGWSLEEQPSREQVPVDREHRARR